MLVNPVDGGEIEVDETDGEICLEQKENGWDKHAGAHVESILEIGNVQA